MKKVIMMLFGCLALTVQAQVVQYCMTYTDFTANNWKPIEELTQGRTKQACQVKYDDGEFKFKTGDKEADKILKKEVLVVKYGNQLFVNSKNLRQNDIQLDTDDYAKAFVYDGDKLCLMGYKINAGAVLVSLGADVAGILVDNKWLSAGLFAGSAAVWLNKDLWHKCVCYLIDSEANEKGKTEVTKIDDKFMEELLADDAALLEKYKAIDSSRKRQAASNVLPILMEKGMIVE